MESMLLKAALKSAGYRVAVSPRSVDGRFAIFDPHGEEYGRELFPNEEAGWKHAVEHIGQNAIDVAPEEQKRVAWYVAFFSKSMTMPLVPPTNYGIPGYNRVN